MDLTYHIVNIFIFKILFNHTELIGGWSEDQLIVFISSYILIDGIAMSFFATGCWWLPQRINNGDLDYYLVRPVSSLFFLSFKDFAANSFLNLLIAIGIFSWSVSNLTFTYPLWLLVVYILFIINGAFVFYTLNLLSYIPVFWTQSPRGFESFLYSADSITKFPDKIQSAPFRFLFTFILPINLTISFPARFFFDSGKLLSACIIIAMSAFLSLIHI